MTKSVAVSFKSKSKIYNETIFRNVKSVSLDSLKKEELRSNKRIAAGGILVIHDLKAKKQYKVNIKNISTSGLCCELSGSAPLPDTEVMIEFCSTFAKISLGSFKSTIKWTNQIQAHPLNNKLIGLEFSSELTATKIKKIEEYISAIQN